MKSEFKFWRWAAVIGVLMLGIVGSIAVAAPKGGGGGSTSGVRASERSGDTVRFERRDPGRHLSALAKELGVSTTRLREALDAVRDDLGPPAFPPRGEQPSKADMEKRCNELTDALASKLDTTGDKVRAAIKTVLKQKIEAAVDAKRLTRAEADRMIARIDDAACLPPLGGHGPGGCGGGPGHGRFGPGDGPRGPAPFPGDSERPAAPPSDGASLAL
jgi:hypothetical protein